MDICKSRRENKLGLQTGKWFRFMLQSFVAIFQSARLVDAKMNVLSSSKTAP